MEFKDDLYAILNVPDYSNPSVVKYAYHTLAKKYHPDVSQHDGKIFAQITDAYKILSNPTSKAKYDEYLRAKELLEQQKLKEQAEEAIKTAQKELNQKRKNFNTSAAKTLHEDKEDLTEPTDTSTKYYVNPAKEPIFTIIRHFTHYRFENALSAIWNRSFFAIFGAAILYTILTPISIFFKICDCAVNKHNYKYHWLATLNINLQNPKIIKPITWTIILYILTITKLITNITYIIFWIFKNLIVPFLIPNAIRSIKR